MSDEQLIEAYVADHPDCLPANNPDMKKVVNSPTYEDRGMWGPYGGKNGTISQPWLDEYKSLQNGAVSEIGLMTIIEPPVPTS